MIGFKYFSSQGGYSAGKGGLDYRCAVFSKHGAPALPCKRDLNVIYSDNQEIMNTGIIYAPALWRRTSWSSTQPTFALPLPLRRLESRFDPHYFDGVTTDD